MPNVMNAMHSYSVIRKPRVILNLFVLAGNHIHRRIRDTIVGCFKILYSLLFVASRPTVAMVPLPFIAVIIINF